MKKRCATEGQRSGTYMGTEDPDAVSSGGASGKPNIFGGFSNQLESSMHGMSFSGMATRKL